MGRFTRKIATALSTLMLLLAAPVSAFAASEHAPTHSSVVAAAPAKAVVAPVVHSVVPKSLPKVVKLEVNRYTVAVGDTLSGIAVSHNVPNGWQGLYDLNRSTVSDPDLIYPGQSLKLNGQVSGDTESTPPPVVHYHHVAPVQTPPVVHHTVTQQAPVQQSQTQSSSSGAMSISDLPASWQCIVFHESTDRNLPYGDASSTGYFQIQQPTWGDFGGLAYAPAPYLATLAQQYQVAQRIVAGQGTTAFSTNAEYGCGL